MKKLLSIALVLCLLLGLTACGKKSGSESPKPAFESEEAFLSFVEDTVWYYEDDDKTCYRIRLFATEENQHYVMAYDLETEDGEDFSDMFFRMLVAMQEAGTDVNFDDVVDFLLDAQEQFDIYTMYADVEYDWETGIVTDGDNVWDFSSGVYLLNDKCSYYEDDTLVLLNNQFKAGYNDFKSAEKEAFLENYTNLVTAKDVKYDIYNNLGKDFALEGSAELDDYFNYDYRDLDSIYFCIKITPQGGSYGDQWYIYASRSTFADLLKTLMDKNLSKVTFICRANYINAGKNSMATLVDFYVD